MPLAVTHVILTVVAVDLYRDYITKHKKYFTLWTVFIAGVAGILPDIDIPINFFLKLMNLNVPLLAHGGITHTPIFGLVFLIPFAYFWLKKKHRLAVIFLVITFGILFHIFLDYSIGGGDSHGIMLFYPFSTARYSIFFFHIIDPSGISFLALDAIILLIWLFHEEYMHKIKDFI